MEQVIVVKGYIVATGNKGFAAGLTGATQAPQMGTRLPPRTGLLEMRENRLAQLATGSVVSRMQELVDPTHCRIWAGHNRDYQSLSEMNCADLIESFKAQGRQEVPAIVRRVKGAEPVQYEVVCGARRHWSVTWMRAHNYPEFRFLVEPRELTDEEAFRLADLENRSRRDLSDYERASDYLRAIDRYYNGSQHEMSERLEVSESWLSRYLDLAKLPEEVLGSFGSPHVIGVSHSAVLAPLLRKTAIRQPLIYEAEKIALEQQRRHASGIQFFAPAVVLQRLSAIAKAHKTGRSNSVPHEHAVRDKEGAIVARGTRAARGGRLSIIVPAPGKFKNDEILEALRKILSELTGKV